MATLGMMYHVRGVWFGVRWGRIIWSQGVYTPLGGFSKQPTVSASAIRVSTLNYGFHESSFPLSKICHCMERRHSSFIILNSNSIHNLSVTPSTWNFGSTDPNWNEIADFQPVSARSSSAVTPNQKSSINVSLLRAFLFLRWDRMSSEAWRAFNIDSRFCSNSYSPQ